MTVQYGEDTSQGTPGYGDLHPALQRHLNSLSDHVNNATTTSYSAQPFEPAQPATQPDVTSPEHIPNAAIQTPNSTPTVDATTAAPQGQTAGQLPNSTAMQGASAGGSADTTHNVAAVTEKPTNTQIQGPGAAPQANIDTSDIDNIGKVADTNQANMVQMHNAQGSSQYQPGGSNPANLQMGTNSAVQGFDGDQVNNAKAIIQAGLARGASRQDIESAVMAGLTESSLHNVQGGDRDSLGLFQMRPSQGWGDSNQIMDPNYSIGKFYDTLSGTNHEGMTPWQADQAVERSAFADGSNYQGNYDSAQRLVAALTQQQPQGKAAAPSMGSNGSLNWISQNTNKYLDYDGWYGAQCVDLYDFYTTGFVGGQAPNVGYADEIWNTHDRSVYTQIDRGLLPQMGDVAVFGKGAYTPMSHVGIILGDNGDGTVKTLSNNATSAGSSGNSAIVNISKASLLGYLRPNRLMGA